MRYSDKEAKQIDKLEIIKELTAELDQLKTIEANYQDEIDHHADTIIELLKNRIQAQKLLNANYLSNLRHLQQELVNLKEDKAFKVIDPDNERIITQTQQVDHSEEIVQQTQDVPFIEYSSCPLNSNNNTNNKTNQDNQQHIVQSLETTYEQNITEEDIDWFEAVTALNYLDSHQHGVAPQQWQEIMAEIFELESTQQCDVLIRLKDFDLLYYANFNQAYLYLANLSSAYLYRANFHSANLYHAHLKDTYLITKY